VSCRVRAGAARPRRPAATRLHPEPVRWWPVRRLTWFPRSCRAS